MFGMGTIALIMLVLLSVGVGIYLLLSWRESVADERTETAKKAFRNKN